MLAELDGDLRTAIRSRESEIRRIFELHSLVQGKAGWDHVFRLYDYRDISDRLDILAIVYAETGDHRVAVRILDESKSFCAAHGIEFDGDDLLAGYRAALDPGAAKPAILVETSDLDAAIISTYRNLRIARDEILTDDEKGRLFVAEVVRTLPDGSQTTNKLIKSRLLSLGRKSEGRGGLPRLRDRA